MRIRRIAALTAAIALPLGAVGTIAAAEFASAKALPDTGTITCATPTHVTATLSTPYTGTGTPGVKKTTTSLTSSTFAGCSRTGTGTATGGSSAAAVIKQKVAAGQNASDCSKILSAGVGGFKLKITWNDGTKSSITLTGGSAVTSPVIGFLETGTVTAGSFVGKSVHVLAALDGPTTTAMVGCIGGSPTPVPSLGLNTTITVN